MADSAGDIPNSPELTAVRTATGQRQLDLFIDLVYSGVQIPEEVYELGLFEDGLREALTEALDMMSPFRWPDEVPEGNRTAWRAARLGVIVTLPDEDEIEGDDYARFLSGHVPPKRLREVKAGSPLTEEEGALYRHNYSVAQIEDAEFGAEVCAIQCCDAQGRVLTYMDLVGDGGEVMQTEGPFIASQSPLTAVLDEDRELFFRYGEIWWSETPEWAARPAVSDIERFLDGYPPMPSGIEGEEGEEDW